MKLRCLIVLLLFFALGGCTPRMIVMLDGEPLPEYAYELYNPATGLIMNVVVAQYIEADEDGEPILLPRFLSVDKMYEVEDDNTRYVKITVIIRNPNKVQYALTESCIYGPVLGRGKTNIYTRRIYEGHLSYKKVEIFYNPVSNVMRKHTLLVENRKRMLRMQIGKFTYKTLPKDPDDNERG